jgi:hypothetical protein
MSDPGDPDVTPQNIAAGRAMQVIGIILDNTPLLRQYQRDPQAAFEAARGQSPVPEIRDTASYEDIPAAVRTALEKMSLPELLFLAEFGEVLVEAGMFIDVPGVGRCYIK